MVQASLNEGLPPAAEGGYPAQWLSDAKHSFGKGIILVAEAHEEEDSCTDPGLQD